VGLDAHAQHAAEPSAITVYQGGPVDSSSAAEFKGPQQHKGRYAEQQKPCKPAQARKEPKTLGNTLYFAQAVLASSL
jgi:hypothetical protein